MFNPDFYPTKISTIEKMKPKQERKRPEKKEEQKETNLVTLFDF
jgi:hypothetical protein